MGNKASYNYLLKQHLTKNQRSGIQTPFLLNDISLNQKKGDGKLRYSHSDYNLAEDDNYICSRKFCSFCLKT